jgi:hypothetical protein
VGDRHAGPRQQECQRIAISSRVDHLEDAAGRDAGGGRSMPVSLRAVAGVEWL